MKIEGTLLRWSTEHTIGNGRFDLGAVELDEEAEPVSECDDSQSASGGAAEESGGAERIPPPATQHSDSISGGGETKSSGAAKTQARSLFHR